MEDTHYPVSEMAENLIGSEIIKLGGEIRDRISKGNKVYNFTIGDFDPEIFPIPSQLSHDIVQAYHNNLTNYPPANGLAELRNAVKNSLKRYQNLDYSENEVLIAGGARPIIYAFFRTVVDPGDKVVFPVPSWNNNHYTHLTFAQPVFIETRPENKFMPTAAELKNVIKGARLLALCSPLNPTGTIFTKKDLEEICDLVLEENRARTAEEKPLYVMYDQIYSQLIFDGAQHYDPVGLRPEMRPYTLYVDGISKSLAATGVRVGWGFGPEHIIEPMKSILGHVGAWSPRPEQHAAALFINNVSEYDRFITEINHKASFRLKCFHDGIQKLKNAGLPVDSIPPEGAIYLTLQFALNGKTTSDHQLLKTTSDITKFLLETCKLAVVPFSAFGASANSNWYRLSVGTATEDDVKQALQVLGDEFRKLAD
jgi:aspartate aminotransferase